MKFRSADFENAFGITQHDWNHETDLPWMEIQARARDAAQAAFDKWLAEQELVYGRTVKETVRDGVWGWNSKLSKSDTHQARLVAIESLPQQSKSEMKRIRVQQGLPMYPEEKE